MTTNYFTLRALVREWQSMRGYAVGDAYSQQRGELTLGFYRGAEDPEWSLRIGLTGAAPYVFRYEGHNRPKRNVTPLFESGWDRPVESIEIAERDRFLWIRFENGEALQIMPFGPRANVFLVDGDGSIREAFRNDGELRGEMAPEPRPAPPFPDSPDALRDRLMQQAGNLAKRLGRALPLVDRVMAEEILVRAGIDPSQKSLDLDVAALFTTARDFIESLADPRPVIYRDGRRPMQFALVPFHHLKDQYDEERYDSVDEAVRSFVRSSLSQQAYDREREPLLTALRREVEALRTRIERMADELARPSRADRYERFGHLLMAHASSVPAGADEAVLPDLFGEEDAVAVPLDETLSAIQNAERYYDRARRTRAARTHAEARFDDSIAQLERLEAALADLEAAPTIRDVKAVRSAHEDALGPLLHQKRQREEAVPYRRFTESGFEILVGKSARHNDRLTFRVARKFDLWLHARGVAGSHVIVRRNRDQHVPDGVLQRAAALAAWFSKARGSALVPVIVTERKFVRSAKGAAPGAVIIEREEVVMVEPEAP